MTCRRAHRLLAAYRRDDWSPSDRAALGKHLSTCASCRRVEAAYRGVGESVRQLPSITPPPGFREAVFAAIRADEQRQGRTAASVTEADTSPELPVISSRQRPISLTTIRKQRAAWINPRVGLVAAAAVVVLGLLSVQILQHSGLGTLAASLGSAHTGSNQPRTSTLTVASYMPDTHVRTISRALATANWLVYSAADSSGATTIYAENRQTKQIVSLAHGSANAPVMLRAVTNDWAFWTAGSVSDWTFYAGYLGVGDTGATALLKSGTAAESLARVNGVWANGRQALLAVTTHAGVSKVLQYALPATNTNAQPATVAQTAVQGHALTAPSADSSSIYWAEQWSDVRGLHSLVWTRTATGQTHQFSPDDTAFAPHIANGLMIWVEGQHGTLEARSLSNSQQKWVVAQSVDSESVRVAGEMVLWRADGALHAWNARTHTASAVEAEIQTAAWVEACESSIVWAGPGGSINVYDVH